MPIKIMTFASLLFIPFFTESPVKQIIPKQFVVKEISSHTFSLNNRYGNSFVNNVFKENILLTIKYTSDKKIDSNNIDWDKINKPFKYSMVLKPDEIFAFHDDVLPEYQNKIDKTTNSHFNLSEGFKSDGYLAGDGVCHLASLLYWVAKDANLEATAPTRHDFMKIPEIPSEFSVSIYSNPYDKGSVNQLQNLYIKNNKNNEIIFEFIYNGEDLSIKATEKMLKTL
ncbi:hypothetical protein LBMAG33_2040 [Candidatus Levyibacteriota bacterium]|nr:hypothetical protein LBMAG33_2040 [Candidatus Levybacteria bacterium]